MHKGGLPLFQSRRPTTWGQPLSAVRQFGQEKCQENACPSPRKASPVCPPPSTLPSVFWGPTRHRLGHLPSSARAAGTGWPVSHSGLWLPGRKQRAMAPPSLGHVASPLSLVSPLRQTPQWARGTRSPWNLPWPPLPRRPPSLLWTGHPSLPSSPRLHAQVGLSGSQVRVTAEPQLRPATAPCAPRAVCRHLLGGPEPWLLLGHHRSLLRLHARWTDVSEAHHGLQGAHLPPRLARSAPAPPWAAASPGSALSPACLPARPWERPAVSQTQCPPPHVGVPWRRLVSRSFPWARLEWLFQVHSSASAEWPAGHLGPGSKSPEPSA